jgi:Lamin Tail Domain
MARSILVLALALAGCARPMLGDPPGQPPGENDLSTAEVFDLAGVDLAGAAPDDLAGEGDLRKASSTDLAAAPAGACHPVVNEVQTGSTQTGTEEFVEIYNSCPSAIALTGWKLVYRSVNDTAPAAGADSTVLVTWTAGSLPAGGYRVYAGANWTGASDGSLASGLAANGAVGLRDASGALVDSVAYGTASGGFAEGAAAPAPPVVASPGNSIQRLPNGADSGDNGHDFRVSTAATPGAANH